ncbi:hypothetical protein EDB85DRAFT_329629 [Lactarius pseudohatsudake]|nr:hypothetical protein EDB85DRAFT_329629 [Lactarius pseudohatsudake]
MMSYAVSRRAAALFSWGPPAGFVPRQQLRWTTDARRDARDALRETAGSGRSGSPDENRLHSPTFKCNLKHCDYAPSPIPLFPSRFSQQTAPDAGPPSADEQQFFAGFGKYTRRASSLPSPTTSCSLPMHKNATSLLAHIILRAAHLPNALPSAVLSGFRRFILLGCLIS